MSESGLQNFDRSEKQKFEDLAATWWDPEGPMKPLHDINPARLQYVAERSRLQGRAVLDVGCGAGILAEALAGQGAKVTGIDVSDRVLNVARLHLHETNLEVNYQAITAEEKARQEGPAFDVITCMELLEHVPEPASVVDAIAELLQPGGHAFFSTLNRTPLAFVLGIVGAEYIARLCPRGTHRYDRFIRPSELSNWLRSAGLEVVDIRGIHYDPLSQSVMLGGHVRMNYILHARRAEAGQSE